MNKGEVCDSDQLKRLRRLILDKTGIFLDETKNAVLISKLEKLATRRNVDSDQILNLVLRDDLTFNDFVNLVTVNHTYFYREPEHFEHLVRSLETNRSDPVTIWCAACSYGHEPYTIAMFCENSNKNYKILATDIDTRALQIAKEAKYPIKHLQNLPQEFHRFFQVNNDSVEVIPKIRKRIRFEVLNLIETPYPLKPCFDYIFCRNVFIYFTFEQKIACLRNFVPLLKSSGFVYLGLSEFINTQIDGLVFKGNSIYEKI
ncbi:MAG: protein-glutamate O-methyltransferase CheR [Deltaproteobacteria bacterium]|nr:protein-glutamate O-methyltransferase CheR [Deltaproteobacteria bacterium]